MSDDRELVETVALSLRQRRKELGFTLRDVEKITGGQVSSAYLSQLENGKIKSPSLRIVCALAAAYSISVETIHDWLNFPPVRGPSVCPTCGQFTTDRIEAIGNTRITPGSDLRDALEDAEYRKELRSILADCSEFLAEAVVLADRCEAMLSQVVAEDHERAALTKDDHGGGQKGSGGISGSTSLRSPEPVQVSALTGNDPGRKKEERDDDAR